MMTPEEFIVKNKELEKSYNTELKSIAKKHSVTGNAMFDPIQKDDPENLRKAKAECINCDEKYSTADKELKDTFHKTFYGIITERDKNKEEVERISKELQNVLNKSKLGDKKMEPKDEKELESVFTRLLEKQNKNSKFESTINDIHTKISKIDSIEKGLLNIIPKVERIDSVEKGLVDLAPKISKMDAIEIKLSSICEDGKCFKTELADIKKDLAETKKGRIKTEICPDCGEPAIVHSETFLASHCANCGADAPGWNNDDGTPIADWKRYKLRGK